MNYHVKYIAYCYYCFCLQFSFYNTRGIPEEVAVKMHSSQGYSDVIFMRGGHINSHFFRKAPVYYHFKQTPLMKIIYFLSVSNYDFFHPRCGLVLLVICSNLFLATIQNKLEFELDLYFKNIRWRGQRGSLKRSSRRSR